MDWLEKQELKELLLELAREPSISGTEQEAEMGARLAEVIRRIPYFQDNPGKLHVNPLEGDPLGRSYLAALFKGGDSSRKTVILLSHFDVVDVLDYGKHRELAFCPRELTAALKREKLPPAVVRDLEEGDYLFGRGVADMKAGIALQLAVLQHLSTRNGSGVEGEAAGEGKGFQGNILFLSVPDEESLSRGVIDCIPFLNKLRDREGLEYTAVVNCEPTFPAYPGDRGNYLYTGSMGKGVVMFYCYGKESHVGDSLSGLNGNLLASEITRQLEGSVDFSEQFAGIVTPPPTCLKQQDFKRLYSAQIPHNAAAYFNILLLTSGPGEVLERMKALAGRAFAAVLDRLRAMRRQYAVLKGSEGEDPGWEVRVMSYGELYRQVYAELGESLPEEIEKIYNRSGGELGQQELALRAVNRVQELSSDKEPKIVVGFLPPYYPPVVTAGDNELERRALEVAAGVIERAAERSGEEIEINQSFPGISDLSYFKLADYEEVDTYLKPNMPGWGMDYSLPLEEIAGLNLPVLNLSIPGRDAHKWQERLELGYYLDVLPGLLKYIVLSLTGSKTGEE